MAPGCDDFLRKPFKEESLLEMIARHLELRYEHEDAGQAELPVDARRLKQVLAAVRVQLQAALNRLNVQVIEQALQRLLEHDARLAEALLPMIECFQYARVGEMLNRAANPWAMSQEGCRGP